MKRIARKRDFSVFVYLFPTAILMFIFVIIPVLLSVYMSFFDIQSLNTEWKFTAFKNYTVAFQNGLFVPALLRTIGFGLFSVSTSTVLGLVLALLIAKHRLLNFYRYIFYIPTVVSSITMGKLWSMMLTPSGTGLLNKIVGTLFHSEPINWLGDEKIAYLVVLGIGLIGAGGGMSLILNTTAINNIPADLYEAASLEGASRVQTALKITIPMIMPTVSTLGGYKLPSHIRGISAEGIRHIKLIDATPIGVNVRSTVATYAGVHDELRKLYARSAVAKEKGFKTSDFSYNTGILRCPECDGTGVVSLDVQFLPDINIPCPECRGSRYAKQAYAVNLTNKAGQSCSLPELMDMDVNSAIAFCSEMRTVNQKLRILQQLGLGYLTLGEETPSLSGGEAQRLKLASEIGKTQTDSVFVFDEPSIGLHPLDVQVLLRVFQALIDNGATVVVIEHDLDIIRNADYIIDMGPGGGNAGGRIVAVGTPQEIMRNQNSITGKYLK